MTTECHLDQTASESVAGRRVDSRFRPHPHPRFSIPLCFSGVLALFNHLITLFFHFVTEDTLSPALIPFQGAQLHSPHT